MGRESGDPPTFNPNQKKDEQDQQQIMEFDEGDTDRKSKLNYKLPQKKKRLTHQLDPLVRTLNQL